MPRAPAPRVSGENHAGAKPFLKWAGGKCRHLPKFREIFPDPGGVKLYCEPFLGAGAVMFEMLRTSPCAVMASDSNRDLINAFVSVRDSPDQLIAALKTLERSHGKAFYYQTRNEFNGKTGRTLGPVGRAAAFVYLNRTCFNGLYRVNLSGEFNVPMGSYKNPTICDEDLIRADSAALAGVDLLACDFSDGLDRFVSWDGCDQSEKFAYLDPPYAPLDAGDGGNFASYTKEKFGRGDQERLKEAFDRLSDAGISAALSNSNCEHVRDLYSGYDLTPVLARRSINSDASGRGRVGEVVATNY